MRALNRSPTDLLTEVMATPGGERVGTCYQCATCSGSCPTAPAMDYTPRTFLHMIRLGLGERVLRSRALWLCTTCYACTTRCPREIKITDTIVGLRSLALTRGVPVPENLVRLRDTVSASYNISGDDNATRPLGRVLADLADTIAERVGLEPPAPGAFDDQGRFFRREFLPQLYRVLGEQCRPVFLLDEFDVLDQVAEAELPETAAAQAPFPFLRRVMTGETQPAFVFVIGRRAEDLSLDFTATFKASLVREIWMLDRESAEALVRQAEGNNTLRFSDQTVERILSLTSCHPYLTQLLCQRIWERAWSVGRDAIPPYTMHLGIFINRVFDK